MSMPTRSNQAHIMMTMMMVAGIAVRTLATSAMERLCPEGQAGEGAPPCHLAAWQSLAAAGLLVASTSRAACEADDVRASCLLPQWMFLEVHFSADAHAWHACTHAGGPAGVCAAEAGTRLGAAQRGPAEGRGCAARTRRIPLVRSMPLRLLCHAMLPLPGLTLNGMPEDMDGDSSAHLHASDDRPT